MSLRHQVERSFQRVVQAIPGLPPVNVYRGGDFHGHQAPCVVCWCKGGREEPKGSGNRLCDVTIIIKSHALEDEKGDGTDLNPIALIENLSTTVFNALKVGDINLANDPDSLAAMLSQTGGLYVFHPVIETGYDPDLADVSFVDTLTFQVYCCEEEVTP